MLLSSRPSAIVLLLLVGVGLVAIFVWGILLPRGVVTPAPTPGPQGRSLYDAHCAVCHGPSGKGDGPGASVIRQPMRDFSNAAVMREVTDRFLFDMIKKGSSQFGRSNAMPAWGMKLSDEEIRAAVAYIRSLAPRDPSARPGRKDTP